jgi:hypothetical protein
MMQTTNNNLIGMCDRPTKGMPNETPTIIIKQHIAALDDFKASPADDSGCHIAHAANKIPPPNLSSAHETCVTTSYLVSHSTASSDTTFDEVLASDDDEDFDYHTPASINLMVPLEVARVSSRPSSLSPDHENYFHSLLLRQNNNDNGSGGAWQTANDLNATFQKFKGDNKKTGLDRQDMARLLHAALEHVKLSVKEQVIELAVEALFEEAQRSMTNDGTPEHKIDFMNMKQFRALFENERELSDGIFHTTKQADLLLRKNNGLVRPTKKEDTTPLVWEHAKTHWINRRRALVWLALYAVAVVAVLFHKVLQIHLTVDKEAAGPWLVLAKASGAALNLHGALMLVPVTKHLNSYILSIPVLRHLFFPADAARSAHMILGMGFVFFTITHILGHMFKYSEVANVGNPAELKASMLSIIGMDFDSLPKSRVGRWIMLLKLRATWTGILMTLFLAVAAVAIPGRENHYKRFWKHHQLLILLLFLQCIHGTANLLQHFQSIYWLAVPLVLYLVPRIYREVKYRSVTILSAVVIKGGNNFVVLTLEKPKSWTKQQAGQYAMLNLPGTSRFEWHPFTISSGPADNHVQFHIQCVGDWTKKLGQAVELHNNTHMNKSLVVRIEGPFGTPVQSFRDHSVVVLIGGGIGVTVSTPVPLTPFSK